MRINRGIPTQKKTFGRRRSTNTASLQTPTANVKAIIPIKTVRRNDRASLWCECNLHSTHAGQEIVQEAVILDRSEAGVRVRSRQRAALPETVQIKSRRLGLNVVGRVVWQKDFDAGIVFNA